MAAGARCGATAWDGMFVSLAIAALVVPLAKFIIPSHPSGLDLQRQCVLAHCGAILARGYYSRHFPITLVERQRVSHYVTKVLPQKQRPQDYDRCRRDAKRWPELPTKRHV